MVMISWSSLLWNSSLFNSLELGTIGLWVTFCMTLAWREKPQRLKNLWPGLFLFTCLINIKEKSRTASFFFSHIPTVRPTMLPFLWNLSFFYFFIFFLLFYSSHQAPTKICSKCQHFWWPHCPKHLSRSKAGWQNGSNWSFGFCLEQAPAVLFTYLGLTDLSAYKPTTGCAQLKLSSGNAVQILNFGSSWVCRSTVWGRTNGSFAQRCRRWLTVLLYSLLRYMTLGNKLKQFSAGSLNIIPCLYELMN